MNSKSFIRSAKLFLKIILTVVLIYLIVIKVGYLEIIGAIKQIELLYLLSAAFLTIPFLLLKIYRWYFLLKMNNFPVGFPDAVKSFLVGLGIGLITPARLGELARAAYINDSRKIEIGILVIIDKIFDLTVFAGVCIVTLLLFYGDFIFKILFSKIYYEAWTISPILCLGPVIMVLRWIAGIGTSIKKKTNLSTIGKLLAAITNIILNFLLIPKYYLMGAAIATLISYIVMLIFAILLANPLFNVDFNKKRIIITSATLFSSYVIKYKFLENKLLLSTVFLLIYIAIYCIFNIDLIKEIFIKLKIYYNKWRFNK